MDTLFTIDPNKCKKDGICVAECPLHLIAINEADQTPIPVDKAERQCIKCGHCVAVCPHDALTLKTMTAEQCSSLDKTLLPDAEQAKLFLIARRSIRVYQKQPVDRDILSDIIDTARYAPTAVNIQPVNWLVIEDSKEVGRLTGLVADWMRYVITNQPETARLMNMQKMVDEWDSGKDRICRRAPHIIIAHAKEALNSAQSSCTIALTYLELAAFAKGLGACWAGFFHAAATNYPPLAEALRLPEGHRCFGAMLVGYPQYQYHRIPLRKEARITWR